MIGSLITLYPEFWTGARDVATPRCLELPAPPPGARALDRRPHRRERDRLQRRIDVLPGLLALGHRVAAGDRAARVALPCPRGRRRPDRVRPRRRRVRPRLAVTPRG